MQVHDHTLRLNYVSPEDSGEYSCQVTGSSGTLEASIPITIEAASNPSPIPGEWHGAVGQVGGSAFLALFSHIGLLFW